MRTKSLTVTGKRGRRKVAPVKRGLPSLTPARILVPIDFSPESTRALKNAVALSKQSGAAITLLHVVEPIHYVCDYGYGPVTREEPNVAMMKGVRTHLRKLGERHLTTQQPWDAVVRSGVAFSEITRAAKELRIDLILMPTRGLTNSKDVPLGSTAERVVRHAPCPVLTLRKPTL
jgi:nucleotide-binding universal stress UspA family protein